MGASASRVRMAGILLVLAPAVLQSQPIYRCGNVYSQMPCADGVVLGADDRRTADQKAQTDAATVQAMRLADRMERDRLAAGRGPAPSAGTANKDKARAPAQPRTRVAARRAEPRAPGKTGTSDQKKEPGDFIASVRQEKKKVKSPSAPKSD